MKKIVLLLLYVAICSASYAKAYRKHVILVGVTEGATHATVITGDGQFKNKIATVANRDPLLLHFGLTNRLSIGLCMGSDIYSGLAGSYPLIQKPTGDNGMVNALWQSPFKVTTNECLVDLDYHYLVSGKWDLSAFGGIGCSSVEGTGTNAAGEIFKYQANGTITRVGSRVRFYFCRHFGLVWMLSSFSSSNAENNKLSNVGTNLSTNISGITSEFGINFRIF